MRQRDMCTTHCEGKYASGCIVQQEFLFANIANRLHQHTDLESPHLINPKYPQISSLTDINQAAAGIRGECMIILMSANAPEIFVIITPKYVTNLLLSLLEPARH